MNLQSHYIRLYKKADDILRAPGNPCNIQKDVEGTMTCTAYPRGSRDNKLCCSDCKHLGPEGCTVMALVCKLGWCYTGADHINGMKREDSPMFSALREVRDEARALGLAKTHNHFSFREYFEHIEPPPYGGGK